jgi:hypothetical protein
MSSWLGIAAPPCFLIAAIHDGNETYHAFQTPGSVEISCTRCRRSGHGTAIAAAETLPIACVPQRVQHAAAIYSGRSRPALLRRPS